MAFWFSARLITAAAAVAAASRKGDPAVKPELVPESHTTFFGKDYPDDIQPDAKIHKEFTHPYPEMQDDNAYDKDYVKDENNDNGEWAAQTEYDHLRTKLQRQKAEQERSKQYKDELQKKLDEARAAEKAASEEAAKNDEALTDLEKKQKAEAEARKRAEQAKEDLKNAEDKHKDSDSKSGDSDHKGADGDSDEVNDASKKVQKELSDIEKCKKELEDAQAELKRLQEERIAAEKADELANDLKAQKLSTEADARKKEAALAAQLEDTQDDYEAKKARADAEAAALAKMEAEYSQAEDKLHQLRRQQVDNGGGVYRTKKSASVHAAHAPMAAILAATVLVVC